MGFLVTGGPPMVWGTAANNQAIPYVKEHGVKQFISLYNQFKELKDKPFLWGEEVEHLVMTLDDAKGTVTLSLTADPLIQAAGAEPTTDSKWLPEYGSFMIETTPAAPYNTSQASLLSVEGVLERRNYLLRNLIAKTDGTTSKSSRRRVVVNLVAFPMMGRPDSIDSATPLKTQGEYSQSIFLPEECTNHTHPRFANLTRNIRLRRGRKVCIQIPMFIDKYTLERSVDNQYRIDVHPANNYISCGPVPESRTAAFDDDDDADEEGEEVTSAKAPPKTAAEKLHELEEKDKSVHAFTHLYTPASDYYYGQYHHDGKREQHVRQRYDACPCPVPSVTHPCVYMDSMAFGMGMGCLQVTMQMPDVDVCRHVYDQLAVVCPMFLALTAATPIQKGYLTDSDVRWMTIAASVDDRKRSEVPEFIKSRYDSVSLFLSKRPKSLEHYNDNAVAINPQTMKMLQEEGFDERLAKHVSHLFIRDPLVIYEERVQAVNDATEVDHFENVQSTNWQTVRFKPPPQGSDIGWRVEFRVMEVSMSAFENAAFSTFITLLTKAIMRYDLWLYIPMSLVDENMGRAHQRGPVHQKYWFTASTTPINGEPKVPLQLSMSQLFNGCDEFAGFIPIVRRLVKEEGIADPRLEDYFTLISRRASGKLQTTADFIREFVTSHPDYNQDSQVTPRIAHDLVRAAEGLAEGTLAFESFLPASLLAKGVSDDNGKRSARPSGAASETTAVPPLKAHH